MSKKYSPLWLLLTGFYAATMFSYILDNSIPMGIFTFICFIWWVILWKSGTSTYNKQAHTTSNRPGYGNEYKVAPIKENTKDSEENTHKKPNKDQNTYIRHNNPPVESNK